MFWPTGFLPRFLCMYCIVSSSCLSPLTSFLVIAEEKHPCSMMLPPTTFHSGNAVLKVTSSVISVTHSASVRPIKIQHRSHLTKEPLSMNFVVSPTWLVTTSQSLSFNYGHCPVNILSHLSCGFLQRLQGECVVCLRPVLSSLALSLGNQPWLGSFVVVRYIFHFFGMID